MYLDINDIAFVSLTRKLRSWTRNIELHKLIPSNSKERGYLYLVVYDEDVVFMSTTAYIIMIHLESFQFKKLHNVNCNDCMCNLHFSRMCSR